MIIDIINKILVMTLIFSILLVLRHTFFMGMAYFKEEKYTLQNRNLIYLGIAISIIITSIFIGIKI